MTLAIQTRERLQIEKIPYVRRKDNAPNVPQVRSIVEFWDLFSRRRQGYDWRIVKEELRGRIHQKFHKWHIQEQN